MVTVQTVAKVLGMYDEEVFVCFLGHTGNDKHDRRGEYDGAQDFLGET